MEATGIIGVCGLYRRYIGVIGQYALQLPRLLSRPFATNLKFQTR